MISAERGHPARQPRSGDTVDASVGSNSMKTTLFAQLCEKAMEATAAVQGDHEHHQGFFAARCQTALIRAETSTPVSNVAVIVSCHSHPAQ